LDELVPKTCEVISGTKSILSFSRDIMVWYGHQGLRLRYGVLDNIERNQLIMWFFTTTETARSALISGGSEACFRLLRQFSL
jgi:hypothetical protein